MTLTYTGIIWLLVVQILCIGVIAAHVARSRTLEVVLAVVAVVIALVTISYVLP